MESIALVVFITAAIVGTKLGCFDETVDIKVRGDRAFIDFSRVNQPAQLREIRLIPARNSWMLMVSYDNRYNFHQEREYHKRRAHLENLKSIHLIGGMTPSVLRREGNTFVAEDQHPTLATT